jgi:hypothetical protein
MFTIILIDHPRNNIGSACVVAYFHQIFLRHINPHGEIYFPFENLIYILLLQMSIMSTLDRQLTKYCRVIIDGYYLVEQKKR